MAPINLASCAVFPKKQSTIYFVTVPKSLLFGLSLASKLVSISHSLLGLNLETGFLKTITPCTSFLLSLQPHGSYGNPDVMPFLEMLI